MTSSIRFRISFAWAREELASASKLILMMPVSMGGWTFCPTSGLTNFMVTTSSTTATRMKRNRWESAVSRTLKKKSRMQPTKESLPRPMTVSKRFS
ncbi:MAG: hypothetical protein ACD_75C00864G0001 [uncultured bacterium]|nr:MAG: hypothetical protein ACD_75C00864G0001 [uncultured bacterium]